MAFQFLTLSFWNGLARTHLTDVVMILSAVILVLMDKPLWRFINRAYRPKSRVMRFIVFVTVCSFGYAALAVLVARLLKWVLLFNGGVYLAPVAFTVLIVSGIIAAEQKHI